MTSVNPFHGKIPRGERPRSPGRYRTLFLDEGLAEGDWIEVEIQDLSGLLVVVHPFKAIPSPLLLIDAFFYGNTWEPL